MRLNSIFLHVFFILIFPGFIAQVTKAIQNPEGSGKTIKIGLLIPDQNSLAARHGAEIAIRIANEKGGFNGRPFQLVVRSMEGPWGTGSKQAVNLIFEENVWAIVGSHDGRNAHLVEQVTTKARIVFLSTWASDPTLSQAFVPWYFSDVPDDRQQADALIEEVYNKRHFAKLAAIADNGYDSKFALENFQKKSKLAGKPDPILLFYDNQDQDFNVITEKLTKADVDGIILFGKPSASLRIIKQLGQCKMNQPVFGTLSLLDENEFSDIDKNLKYFENIVLVYPAYASGLKGLTFTQEFQRTYGKKPGAVAAYTFDGMSLIIEAIRSSGLDRDKIQKYLTKIHFEGVTGPIQFDDKGKRVGKAGLMQIKNGIPVTVER